MAARRLVPASAAHDPFDEVNLREDVLRMLRSLPERQRAVVTLRDVHGLSSDEVCAALDLSQANQRVLLHRGRARLRTVLEDYYRGSGEVTS